MKTLLSRILNINRSWNSIRFDFTCQNKIWQAAVKLQIIYINNYFLSIDLDLLLYRIDLLAAL